MMKQEILEVLQNSLPPLLKKGWRPDCCIAATRVICRVMKHFGIDAQPLPVVLLAYNAAYIKAIQAGDGPPTHDHEEFLRWCQRLGAWSLGITDEVGGIGHIVAVLPGEQLLIDGSIGQISRPEKGLPMPAMLISKLPRGFLTDPAVVIELGNAHGNVLIYKKAETGQLRYLASPDWTEKQRTKPVVKQLVREIEKYHVET
jgi:hypothetical protein